MIEPGTRIGPYEIVAPLGAGGMGEVYRARDTKLGREVALKALPEEFARDEGRLARFEREAKLLASLNHPRIAAIYGLEEAEGQPFLVLELVEGEDLEKRLERGPIPVDEALAIARQIAEALEEAHGRGIVHRDLKPANVKRTPEGKVKVLDFGLARAYGNEDAGAVSEVLSQSPTQPQQGTVAGAILGTPAYMSPEQARGLTVDKRADIWAFGVVVFEMLTGARPFSGATVSDTLAAVLERDVDWNRLPGTTPDGVRRVLRRCLDKDPDRRLHDIADARIEIEDALADGSGGTVQPATLPGVRRSGRRTLPWALAAVAALASGLAAWSLMRTAPAKTQGVARVSITLPPGEPLGLDPFRPAVAISPDGSRVAYVTQGEDGRRQLYVRALDRLKPIPVSGAEDATSPFFSPDGRWIGFLSFGGGAMKKVSVTGGAPIVLFDAADRAHGTWAPDDTIIFSHRTRRGLWRVPASGGTPEALTPIDSTRGLAHWWPEVLPGGKAVLFAHYPPDAVEADDAHIKALSLDTGEEKTLLKGGNNPRYAETGHLIYARSGSLRAVKFDLDRLEVTGPSVQVLEGVRTHQNGGAPSFAVSRSGTLVYVPGGPQLDRALVWVNRRGEASPVTQDERGYYAVRLSPDGQRIAVLIGWQLHNVWIYDLSRGTLDRLTHLWDQHNQVWTPDGERVVFSSSRVDPKAIFWKSADGTGDVELLLQGDRGFSPESFSPDGQLLAFTQSPPFNGKGEDILLYSMDGKHKPRTFRATEFSESRPSFSPDGRWIAYESDETGRDEVYVAPYPGPGASARISAEGGRLAVWAPSGRELFYRNGDKMMAVAVETQPAFRAGQPRLLFTGRYFRGRYDISGDGERFLMIQVPEMEPVTQLNVVFNWFEELKATMREAEE